MTIYYISYHLAQQASLAAPDLPAPGLNAPPMCLCRIPSLLQRVVFRYLEIACLLVCLRLKSMISRELRELIYGSSTMDSAMFLLNSTTAE